METINLLCIGSACEGHELIKMVNDETIDTPDGKTFKLSRVKGPVDNMSMTAFNIVELLFDGLMFKSFKKKEYKLEYEHYTDNIENAHYVYPQYCFLNTCRMIHNDFTDIEVYKELLDRIKNFNTFKDNDHTLFIYTVGNYDKFLKIDAVKRVIDLFPYIRYRTIVVDGDRFGESIFSKYKVFPVIHCKPWTEPEQSKETFKNVIIDTASRNF